MTHFEIVVGGPVSRSRYCGICRIPAVRPTADETPRRWFNPVVTIKTVAFDFGGVLTCPPFSGLEKYAVELGLPPTVFNAFFRTDPKMSQLLVGRTTTREFLKYVCIEIEARHGIRVDIRRLGTASDVGTQGILPVMARLVEDVGQRCQTILLTNNARGTGWRQAFPFELFDHALDSSVLGLRKPDPRIYQELIRVAACRPDEIVFIDDFEENLPPAADLGIATILFPGSDACRAALIERGVLDA
jgi:epoxide hydrolase-like predicted phosphatase